MMNRILQKEFKLTPKSRGFHLITDEIIKNTPDISEITIGVMHVYLKHTSASLIINENADPTVRKDFESYFNKFVPEGEPYFKHTSEGPDDMPAHLKAAILGISLQIPITNGKLNLGTWQGIYLCEHRDQGGYRNIVVAILGN